jgi:hypothetical protein
MNYNENLSNEKVTEMNEINAKALQLKSGIMGHHHRSNAAKIWDVFCPYNTPRGSNKHALFPMFVTTIQYSFRDCTSNLIGYIRTSFTSITRIYSHRW